MKSNVSYFVNGSIRYHQNENGMGIKINDDATYFLYFGMKIKFTPTEIIIFGKSKNEKTFSKHKTKKITKIRIFNDLVVARNKNDIENRYASAYWESIENNLFG